MTNRGKTERTVKKGETKKKEKHKRAMRFGRDIRVLLKEARALQPMHVALFNHTCTDCTP